MLNNENDLSDIMEVLHRNSGRLTAEDRNIPEDDTAVISLSAWSHIPVFKTEEYWMEEFIPNNQIPVLDHSMCNMDMLHKENIFYMPRRPHNASEARRQTSSTPESNEQQSADYHYMYNDISFGIGNMSMNQQSLFDDDKSSSHSESLDADDSSDPDWCPGSSHGGAQSTVCSSIRSPPFSETSTRKSESPFEAEADTCRLSRSRRKYMTKEELEQRRKAANKRNSKNYNKNKKNKEATLSEQLVREKFELKEKKDRDRKTKCLILDCYSFTGSVVIIENEKNVPHIPDRAEFEELLRNIDRTASNMKESDADLRNLAQKFQEKERKYREFKNDHSTKKSNVNTYGSRKSRALHSMNIAELELKRKKLEFEFKKFEKRSEFMKTIEGQMARVFKFRYVGAEYCNLTSDRKAQFDELCTILKAQYH